MKFKKGNQMIDMIREEFQETWQDFKQFRYMFLVVLVLVLAGIGVGGYYGYNWYRASSERDAQLVMADAYHEYTQAIQSFEQAKDENDQLATQHLEDAILACDMLLRSHGNTYLAAYAQAFKADLLIIQNQKQEGLALLEQAVTAMNNNYPGYYLFKNKIALVRIDLAESIGDAAGVELGVKQLHELVVNPKNPASTESAYFLGEYYWSINDTQKAQEAWQNVLNEKKDMRAAQSPYEKIIIEKLKQLGVQTDTQIDIAAETQAGA